VSRNTALTRPVGALTAWNLDRETNKQIALVEAEADIATAWITNIEIADTHAMGAITELDLLYQAFSPHVSPIGQRLLQEALVVGGRACIGQVHGLYTKSQQRRR